MGARRTRSGGLFAHQLREKLTSSARRSDRRSTRRFGTQRRSVVLTKESSRKGKGSRSCYGGNDGLVFKGIDIVEGAELLWDPLILDQMFQVQDPLHVDPDAALAKADRLEILHSIDLWKHVRQALTSRQYQILEHYLFHGYSVVQIANLLQVKQPVISMLLRTSFEKLRKSPMFKSLRHLL